MDTLSTRLNGWDNACQACFNKTNSLLSPLILPVLFGKQSLSSHTDEILLSYWERFSFLPSISACDHIFDHLEWQLDIPYLFILWLKLFPLWSLGTLLAPGPCVFWAVDKLPYFMEGTGLDSTLGTEEKLETNVWNNRHDFKCQKVGLNSKNLKKKIK